MPTRNEPGDGTESLRGFAVISNACRSTVRDVKRNKTRHILAYLVVTALSIGFYGYAGADGKRITAFCGAASKPAMEEAAKTFEDKTGIRVDLHFGGSGSVLSQMKMARRGDVFIPGSPDYMAKAKREEVVKPETTRIIAYLVIAINVQHGNPKGIRTLADLARAGIRVGIGNPEAVCVGLYAVEVLERNGLLEKVRKNIVTNAPSCSATAALLAMEKVDAVIGWRVFSKWNGDKIDAVLLKPNQISRLAYIPAAVSTYSQDEESAQRFIEFLASAPGRRVFTKWGYITTEEKVRRFAPTAEIGGEYTLAEHYTHFVDK
jgi:molybdate transport system substrate-binding protein